MDTHTSKKEKKRGYITCKWYEKGRLFSFISTSEHRELNGRTSTNEQWWLNTEDGKSISELLKLQK
jgi:hypothetical protein